MKVLWFCLCFWLRMKWATLPHLTKVRLRSFRLTGSKYSTHSSWAIGNKNTTLRIKVPYVCVVLEEDEMGPVATSSELNKTLFFGGNTKQILNKFS